MKSSIAYTGFLIKKEQLFLVALVAAAFAGGAMAFPLEFLTRSNELIGICLLPFVINISSGKRFNYLFFVLLIFFGIAAFCYSVRMFYFFALVFYLLWVVEILIGRVNVLTIFLLAFMSPFFSQVSAILGFPIRLQLSQFAGVLLGHLGMDIRIDGNMLLLNGAVFTVDEACMGLNMAAISMLMGVFILAFHGRDSNRSLRLNWLLGFFALVFLLNIIANLFRIVFLVLFKVVPQDPMHEIVGILCLSIYVVIPMYLLGRWLLGKYGRGDTKDNDHLTVRFYVKLLLPAVGLSLLYTGVSIREKRSKSLVAHVEVRRSDFKVTEIDNGVTKLSNSEVLIYIKPIPEFFTGEHTPLLCWRGSGYEFRSIGKYKINGREIYSGLLVKKAEKLFTAWWYTNGNVQTISQFDWRLRMMKGEEKFKLINVTASDESELIQNIKKVFDKELLSIKSQ